MLLDIWVMLLLKTHSIFNVVCIVHVIEVFLSDVAGVSLLQGAGTSIGRVSDFLVLDNGLRVVLTC